MLFVHITEVSLKNEDCVHHIGKMLTMNSYHKQLNIVLNIRLRQRNVR